VAEPRITCLSSFPGRPARQIPWPADAPTALHALRAGQQPIASSCSGETVCGKCGVFVEAVTVPLPPAEVDEEAILAALDAEPTERLACRIRREDVRGSIALRTNYW